MKNVLILFGGESGEYDVSLRTAYAILCNINRDKYSVFKVGITRSGELLYFSGEDSLIENDSWESHSSALPCDFSGGCLIADGLRVKIDAALLALHGAVVEDGCLQGYLRLAKIPYASPNCQASAVCMDKEMAKTLLLAYGIPMAKYISAEAGEGDIIERTEAYLDYPVFVKPARSGSSLGASVAQDRSELLRATSHAFSVDSKILIEEYIRGKEIEIALLQRSDLTTVVSVAGEIDGFDEFYDYESKYVNSSAHYHIPARISDSQMSDAMRYAEKIFRILGCSSLARIDFFVSDKIYFNEINTQPGFTSISMYPRLMKKMGYSFPALLDELIAGARIK